MLAWVFKGVALWAAATQNAPVFQRPIETTPADKVAALYQKSYGTAIPAETAATYIKVSFYSSHAPKGYERQSGLLAIPADQPVHGLVLFNHGTCVRPEKVPSRLADETRITSLPFLSRGYAVIYPDYVGQGDGAGRHPYPFGKINAWSGLDMIVAVQKLLDERGWRNLPNYVTGYSEGGAVAMWCARLAQENPQAGVKFVAAAPLSGPYDLSDTTAKSMVSNQSNPLWRAVRVFLIGYVGWGAEKWIPNTTLESLFVPSFAKEIRSAFQKGKSDDDITKRLVVQALKINPMAQSVRPVIQGSFLQALQSRDLSHPVLKAFRDNDCYDWTPRIPLKMVALENDFVVVNDNARKAYSAMQARAGQGESLPVWLEIVPGSYNHLTGVPICVSRAADFFESIGHGGMPR